MIGAPRQNKKPRHGVRNAPGSPERWIAMLPALLVVVLNLPSLLLGYFWDDFYFLTFKGSGDVWANLLPDAHAAFYRPIPLGIYFKFLRFVDPANGILGHVVNLAALLGVVALLVSLVTRLCGPRAGLFSGIVFALYSQVPSLVAWVSCSQDLFAILFVVAAFLLRHRGKNVAALACATAGLLCKEPALAAFPVLLFWDRLVGREAVRPRFTFLGYGAVALGWALIHPGIHLLAGSGFKSGATGYVGIEHPERWGLYFGRYLMTLINLPPSGLSTPWWVERAGYGVAGLAIVVGGLWSLDGRRKAGVPDGSLSLVRVGWITALFVIPSLLMPTILVRHWTPYFACLPALGVAMFLGPVLAKQGRLVAIAALAAFSLLGIWSRGSRAEREWVLSERAMVEAASAVRTVRANVKSLVPKFPPGGQVVLSFGTRGIRGIQSALIDGQALSLWYRDPTLRTVTTAERRSGEGTESFLRVTNDLDVIALDLKPFGVRSTRPGPPDLAEIDQPLNNFARALAAGGETERAVHIMEGLTLMESGDLVLYNRRLIASMFLAAGRRAEAESLLAITAPFPKEVAQQLVTRLLADASASEELDTAAFEAFGLAASDPATLRGITRSLQQSGALAQAAWFAEKLENVAPGDESAAEVRKIAADRGVAPRREPPRRLASPHANG